MTISELQASLQKIMDQHGDLEVLMSDYDSNVYSISFANYEKVADGDAYPKDWEMPEGFEFVQLNT